MSAGTPWRAHDALDVMAILDMPAWHSLLGLLSECPVLPEALTATLEGRTGAISATSFAFIATGEQIGTVRAFMDRTSIYRADERSTSVGECWRAMRRECVAKRQGRTRTGRAVGVCDPVRFWRSVIAPFVMAFSTSSSMATLPTSLVAAEQRPKIAGFVLPLGATMNRTAPRCSRAAPSCSLGQWA